ncbi:protein dimerization isoform X2 [Carex rostrata]
MSLGMDEWDESFLRLVDEALASRNLPTPATCPARAPQPPTLRPSPPPLPHVANPLKFDGVSDAASVITEVQFSPPRELSQMHRIERQGIGDDFEVVDSWGGNFGNTDSVTKNNKEMEKLKRDVSRLSGLLKHRDSECSELKKDNAKKYEQLKHAHQQIEARDTEIRNLKRANVEHTPVPVRKPPPATVISNGGSKERKLAHLPSNREDPMMAPIPKLLESSHHTMNDIALSTSKSTGIKTACVQDGNINNDCSTTSNSLYGEQICSNLRAIWGIKSSNRIARRELISSIFASCSDDIFAPFDDREMSEAGTSDMNCSDIGLTSSNAVSRLQALVPKVRNQTAELHHVVEELLNLCRVKNVSLIARSLKILRTILHHLISSGTFLNQRENVSAGASPTDNKQGKRSKNEISHVMDLCLLNEDANCNKMIDLPSIWWVAIFDAARETIKKNPKESYVHDALFIMILTVMRSDANTDREKFRLAPVLECVHLLLNKDTGPFVKKQAVYLLFLILNCPETLALFCSGGREGVDVISEKAEELSGDVLQRQIGLLLVDLGECLSCPLSGSMDLKLVRQVIILLAYIASYGLSGFKFLLGPVGPTELNLLELIVQVLSAQMDLENSKERNLVMREALILLNRFASNYSKTTLEVLTRKSCASLIIDIANRIPRMGRGSPRTNNTHIELEIADLARVFSSRLFSLIGER